MSKFPNTRYADPPLRNTRLYAEGNNGGDFVDIRLVGDNELEIRIGSSCVHTLDYRVPVEWLSCILSGVASECASDIKQNAAVEMLRKYCRWDEKFRDQIEAKIHRIDSHG